MLFYFSFDLYYDPTPMSRNIKTTHYLVFSINASRPSPSESSFLGCNWIRIFQSTCFKYSDLVSILIICVSFSPLKYSLDHFDAIVTERNCTVMILLSDLFPTHFKADG